MVADFWKNLNLFKVGSDDNTGVEESLDTNFKNIDEKLGNALKDKNAKVHVDLGTRLDEELTLLEDAKAAADLALSREYNMVRDDMQHHTLAYKGFSKGGPENTMHTFKLAKEMGFWGIKSEVRLTYDNEFVMHLDDTVDRTSNNTGTVASKTLATLKTYDFGIKKGTSFEGERIPTLKEFLWFCRLHNMVAYIEIKSVLTATHAQNLVAIIKDYSMEKRCALLSTSIPTLQLIRDLNLIIELGYVTSALTQTNIDYAKQVANSFIYVLWSEVVPAKYILAITAGIKVDAWNPQEYTDIETAIKNGARRVTTSSMPF